MSALQQLALEMAFALIRDGVVIALPKGTFGVELVALKPAPRTASLLRAALD